MRNSISWKVFFWINASLMLIATMSVPLVHNMNLLDYFDLSISLGCTLGLYGFAFYRPLYNILFWRYFFYLALFDFSLYSLILPTLDIPRYGQDFTLDVSYALELMYSITLLYALNHYAYKRAFIWNSQS